MFELAVGLDLLRLDGELFYWRQDQCEVDYGFKRGSKVIAIEVKSGRKKSAHGLVKFRSLFSTAASVVITPDNYPEFTLDPWQYLR